MPQTCAGKSRHIYIQAGGLTHVDTNTTTHTTELNRNSMHTNTHRSFPSVCLLSVAFLSLPLAVSQIPNDVLTGGLSDWR